MTWSAHPVVTDVHHDTAGTIVRAAARAGDEREVERSDGETAHYPRINSNTEGKITEVIVEFVLEGNDTTLKPGDELNVSGHFTS